jgi:hypothetical protein
MKGIRGPNPNENSLRRTGWRPTVIRPHFKQLVEKLAEKNGWSKSEVIERALIWFAISEDVGKGDIGHTESNELQPSDGSEP